MCMIFINEAKLPRSHASYLAFRIAFQETWERITLARQFPECAQDGFGFLTEVPFLSTVSPMVQLDLLAQTWQRHICNEDHTGTIIDEAVIYAVCERSAWSMENESRGVIERYLLRGPDCKELVPERSWSADFRRLHAELSTDADFLLISQLEDLPPQEASKLKKQWGMDSVDLEPLFDCQSRWFPSPSLRENLTGLLSHQEIDFVSGQLGLPLVAE